MRGGPRGIPLGLTGLLLVCSLLLGGCGGAATPTSAAAGFSTTKYAQQIAVTADPQGGLRWDRQEYEAQAGAATFVVGNDPIVLAAESGGGGVSDRLHPAGSSGGGMVARLDRALRRIVRRTPLRARRVGTGVHPGMAHSAYNPSHMRRDTRSTGVVLAFFPMRGDGARADR